MRARSTGLAALDVMVLVHLCIAPVGDLVGFAVPREQGLALLVLEHHQGLPASGAVDAQTGDCKRRR